MTEDEADERRPGFLISVQHYGETDAGSDALGHFPSEMLDAAGFKPFMRRIGSGKEPFQFIFDYFTVRCCLLLSHIDDFPNSVENGCLRRVSEAVEHESGKVDESVLGCLSLFWRHVAEDFEVKECDGAAARELDPMDRWRRKEMTPIQLKTVENGTLHALVHKGQLSYPVSDPIKNPRPGVSLIRKEALQFVSEIAPKVLKVKIDDKVCCAKSANGRALFRETPMLAKMPEHPSLPKLIGVVDAGDEKVDQIVMAYIDGMPLNFKSRASDWEKRAWKEQITSAVQLLHVNGMVWVDVKPDIVMIERSTGRAILIDFGGGCCKP